MKKRGLLTRSIFQTESEVSGMFLGPGICFLGIRNVIYPGGTS